LINLTDTHCHLDFDNFHKDREEVLARAWEHGLYRILIPGIDLNSSRLAVSLAESHPQLYAAVGVHPNSATTWEVDTLSELRELAGHPKVVAIGEIGLDYYRHHAPPDVQRRVFQTQLELAAEVRLPVVIHNRQASSDLFSILGSWIAQLEAAGSPLVDRPGVLHSFSDSREAAERALNYHFCLGFTGPVTFINARRLQKLASEIPLEQMLIETDAPFLTPHPYRGQRNEPMHVRLVADKIHRLKNIPFEVVAQKTAANAARLFDWGVPD
jgi:TatD DNase family protein